MKAAVVTAEGLVVKDVAVPQPGPAQVLVKIGAAALNRADLAVVSGGQYGRTGGVGAIPGIEWAGEVVAAGSDVVGFKTGDRVMAAGSGGYAEYAVSDWGRTLPLPNAGMSFTHAATLPIALQTMHDAIVTNGRLQKGDAILIQGASSGVGIMGLQIAKFMGARLVIGSSTNPARRTRLAEFGAGLVVDTSAKEWVEQVLEATGGKGVDVIVDQISASVANDNMRATALKGRIVNVGRLGGSKGEFDFDLHAARRIQYIGVTFRTRTVEDVRDLMAKMQKDLWPAIEAGQFKMPLDRTFSLADVASAVTHMRTNAHFGKIVLTM
jgi:NADPH:quinone reductase